MRKMRHRKIKAKFNCVWIAQGHSIISGMLEVAHQQNKSWIIVDYLFIEELTSEKHIFHSFHQSFEV